MTETPQSIAPFAQWFELTDLGPDDLGAHVFERIADDHTWWGWNGQFGGYVMGLALQACRRVVATPTHRELALSVHFLRRVPAGPLHYSIRVERVGRTITNLTFRITGEYDGVRKLCGTGSAMFGSDRDADDWQIARPPDLALPAADEAPQPSPIPVPALRPIAIWPRHEGGLMSGTDVAESGGWMQLHEPGGTDERFLFFITDGYLPVANIRGAKPAVGGTLDFTANFRQPIPQRVIDGEPLRVVLRSGRSHRGYVDEDAQVWTAAGELLMQSRQTRYAEYIDPATFER